MNCAECRRRRAQLSIAKEDLRKIAQRMAASDRMAERLKPMLEARKSEVGDARSVLVEHEAECAAGAA